MEIDISKLEEVCGSKPSNMEFILVGNDPNFVYQIDPSYQVKILYDAESNIINVNSWLECGNYVAGGWSDVLPGMINWERSILIIYSLIIVSYLIKDKLKDLLFR
tara:strand:- start:837 stop:1151 length:315 start_codon:yes stop_codon:yes gene_type:complete